MMNKFSKKVQGIKSIVNCQLLTVVRSAHRGFTLPEVVIVIGILFTLLGIATISLLNAQNRVDVSSTVEVLIADLKEQQTKAMTGDSGGGSSASDYGIHFDANSYTLFVGNTYTSGASTNFSPSFPSVIQITTTFAGGNIVFTKGSGEATAGTITFTNTANNEQRTVTVNKYGVITGVN